MSVVLVILYTTLILDVLMMVLIVKFRNAIEYSDKTLQIVVYRSSSTRSQNKESVYFKVLASLFITSDMLRLLDHVETYTIRHNYYDHVGLIVEF